MSHPYWIPDKDMVSNCCGALSATEIVDGDAICSKCGEHADFQQREKYDFWARIRDILEPYRPLFKVLDEIRNNAMAAK